MGNESQSDRQLAIEKDLSPKDQLRVHCAHQEGLNAPIIGDPLYGNEPATRLHLHAEEITLEHPMTGKNIGAHVIFVMRWAIRDIGNSRM